MWCDILEQEVVFIHLLFNSITHEYKISDWRRASNDLMEDCDLARDAPGVF
jgi:hypothetical protein